jgi:hypothetical protein
VPAGGGVAKKESGAGKLVVWGLVGLAVVRTIIAVVK